MVLGVRGAVLCVAVGLAVAGCGAASDSSAPAANRPAMASTLPDACAPARSGEFTALFDGPQLYPTHSDSPSRNGLASMYFATCQANAQQHTFGLILIERAHGDGRAGDGSPVVGITTIKTETDGLAKMGQATSRPAPAGIDELFVGKDPKLGYDMVVARKANVSVQVDIIPPTQPSPSTPAPSEVAVQLAIAELGAVQFH